MITFLVWTGLVAIGVVCGCTLTLIFLFVRAPLWFGGTFTPPDETACPHGAASPDDCGECNAGSVLEFSE